MPSQSHKQAVQAFKSLITQGDKLELMQNGIARLESHMRHQCYLCWQDGELWLFRPDGDGILGATGLEDLIVELGYRGDLSVGGLE